MEHFALAWDEHVQNVCTGISLLQQNGELVDMTLAADGHHVKVHQVIIALSSPFLKDLISTAKCTHPVIFLSKISHTTLSALLEYMYTGEVLVAIEDLNELIDAAKELHIKGLQEMTLSQALTSERQKSPEIFSTQIESMNIDQNICYFETPNNVDVTQTSPQGAQDPQIDSFIYNDVQTLDDNMDGFYETNDTEDQNDKNETIPDFTDVTTLPINLGTLQYTVSNQGSLQLILNRFIYYLKHTNRNMARQWRCVEYLTNTRCPAYVFTKDDVVIQRISAHNHPFHDKRIMKKLKVGSVFTALKDAENGANIRKNKEDENE